MLVEGTTYQQKQGQAEILTGEPRSGIQMPTRNCTTGTKWFLTIQVTWHPGPGEVCLSWETATHPYPTVV